MSDYQLHMGDCLDFMRGLDAGSIDAIITDIPYGTTACDWDEIIPFHQFIKIQSKNYYHDEAIARLIHFGFTEQEAEEKWKEESKPGMWEGVKRVLKRNGVFVTTASQPFTSLLVCSNLEWFKYEWQWEKDQVTNPQLAKYMPLKNYESVLVFCEGTTAYNPQNMKRTSIKRKPDSAGMNLGHLFESKSYTQEFTNYPKMTIYFETERGEHPTQKPVALYEYLIRTYTNPGETVLDFCFGSGTTGVAAIQTGRKFIGCELKPEYFAIAEKRIAAASLQIPLPMPERERAEQGSLL